MSHAEQPIHCVCGRVVAFTDPEVEAERDRYREALRDLVGAVDAVCDHDAATGTLPDHARSVLEYPLPAARALLGAVGGDPE